MGNTAVGFGKMDQRGIRSLEDRYGGPTRAIVVDTAQTAAVASKSNTGEYGLMDVFQQLVNGTPATRETPKSFATAMPTARCPSTECPESRARWGPAHQ